MSFSKGSSQPRDWTQVSCIACRFFTHWTIWETQIDIHIQYDMITKFNYQLSPYKVIEKFLAIFSMLYTSPSWPFLYLEVCTVFLTSSCHLMVSGSSKWFASSVQSLIGAQLFVTPWSATHQTSLSFTNSWSLLKLMSLESVMTSNYLILCRPLLLLPWIFLSIRIFSNELAFHIRWPKYWSFSFNISSASEYSGLTSFRMDWLDLLAVQGALKSLLQHHSPKTSILWHSAFFTVQLSHPYMTTGKTIALTRWTFAGKAMPLLFNMLSRLVITFLPRSKHLLISWLQSPSAMILEPPNTVSYCFHCSPPICHEVMGPDTMIFTFWMLNFKPVF